MLSPRHQRLTLGLIALLAVGWAQTFGLHRGFMCDCGGVEHITQVDHCHGPHSNACHDVEDHDIPHQHDETDEDTHQHAVVTEALLAKQPNAAGFDLAAPMPMVIAEIVWEISVRQTVTLPVANSPGFKRWCVMQEWPHRIVQTIALRI
ncbi:MAG: hypothetical protein ACKVY0_13475 [Prosthecobacter sp.]|uniref:hypothetical protein n=1 Tax=Prosthecobacter sp. TaxID=1965333 RepID=UPI00390244E4